MRLTDLLKSQQDTRLMATRRDFGENVRGGGKIFRGGATIISPSQQRVKIKKYLTLITFI